VYLAYGLHGQAEELLTKAIERKPDHPEYVQKLLQTYHAQGNADGFHQAAQKFHNNFGGDSNPDWSAIAVMGQELRPNDALYSSATDDIASVGVGDYDAPKMQADDFASVGDNSTTGSISRGDFSSSDATLDISADESALMDQSLDPAFAFDEGDLDATGDFSQIANELAQEDESIDFPDLVDTGGALGAAVAGAAGLGGLAAASASATDALATGDSTLQDAMSLDGFDISSAGADSGAANDSDESLDFSTTADDLTLDLDQLTGEMELDGTEMLDDSVSELEIPDLTADNDQLLTGDVGTSADEMDTMMDLAKAYIDMGDKDSASSALGEIVKGGSPEQISEAETLLRKIS
jgi:pilus assembly protein FimV